VFLFSKQSDAKLDGLRYEVKIPMEAVQLSQFHHHLYELGLYPMRPFPPRKVSSVYYDTRNFDDYTDNVSGIANRTKIRIRWYNDDLTKLTLEFKIKKNKASFKESLKIANLQLYDPATRDGVRLILRGLNKTTEHNILLQREPIIQVEYDREYFLLNEELRMTIDVNQKFKKLYPFQSHTFMNSPVTCVAEFKYPASKRLIMQSMLRNLPFRVFRHSKYVIGNDLVAS